MIAKGLQEGGSKRDVTLSQALRMYYSDTGLPGNQAYRACNRVKLYEELDKDTIKTQVSFYKY